MISILGIAHLLMNNNTQFKYRHEFQWSVGIGLFPHTVDVVAYTSLEFAADVGGSVGLFLGLSVLSVLQMLDLGVARAWSFIYRKYILRFARASSNIIRRISNAPIHDETN